MNRHGKPWYAGLVCAALLLTPALAGAQSPYEGIYMGAFRGTADDGEFALVVDHLGHGTMAAYDAIDDRGDIENNIYIRPDGWFRLITRRGVHIEGRVDAGGVTGRYYGADGEGSFDGWRAPDDGPLQEAVGYYSGPATVSDDAGIRVNSRMVSIIAADGSAFFMLDRAFPGFPGLWPGGIGFSFGVGLGFGIGFDSAFYTGSPHCGPWHPGPSWGWPFNAALGYSFEVSVLGIVEVDFAFSLNPPSCRPGLPWRQAFAPVEYSGGIILIGEDGGIDATLLDGLYLQGRLDVAAASADGVLHQAADGLDWYGHWSIERHGDGKGIESAVQFHRLPDLNGDGLADIPWRHAVVDEQALWLMDGSDVSAELPLDVRQAASPAGLAWREPFGGSTFVWFEGDAAPVRFEADPVLLPAGVGDFDGDGSVDVLWRDIAAGSAHLMLRPGRFDTETVQLEAPVSRGWLLAAVGDLDGDGADDVVWRDSVTGENTAWFISAAGLTGAVSLMPAADPHWVIQP